MREVELKGVTDDPEAVTRALGAAGAVRVYAGRLRDRRYDTVARALIARDEVLRLRVYDGKGSGDAMLDWKGPTTYADGYKVREEISTSAGDGEVLATMLERLGYEVIREIDREIAQYAVCGATVRIEWYPRMDVLIEVEGEPAAIEAAIAVLGVPRVNFTSERLPDFVARFEARTGQRAAICQREIAGDYRYGARDA